MARPPRIEFAGAVYHVTSRGNARQDIVRDDIDREKWVDWLRRTVETYNWRLHTDDASRAVAAYLARRRCGHPAGKVADAVSVHGSEISRRALAPVRLA